MKLNFFEWKPADTTDPVTFSPVPLVFLHGMGGTGQIWRPLAASLEDQFICIAPDQRGHGGSRPVPDVESEKFHAEDYARDVSALLARLKIERYFLIGHSMGVRTSLALAHLEPKKVSGLIAIDIGISSEWGGGIGKPLAEFLMNLPKSFSDRLVMKNYLLTHCPDPSIAQYLAAVAKRTGTPEVFTFPFDRHDLVKTIQQANEAPIEAWLLQILDQGVKTIFLRGANSKVWLKNDYEEQKARLHHPLLEFQEWENAGHGLPFEQRARLINLIREFSQVN